METVQQSFLEFLGQPDVRFTIPVFQRVYSWSEQECADFWEDVNRAGEQGEQHFMGVLLHAIDPEGWQGAGTLDIIDGQQRMTTLSIVLAALAEHLEKTGAAVDGMDGRQLRRRYLLLGDGEKAEGKLVLTFLDRYTLFAVAAGVQIPDEHADRILANYNFFAREMEAPGFELEQLWRGLTGLFVVSTRLTGDDQPQLVFESLNSKGLPLTTADLVRNELMMQGSDEQRNRLYQDYWSHLENLSLKVAGDPDATPIINAWLAQQFRSTHLKSPDEVYNVFKTCLANAFGGSFEKLLRNLLAYAERYAADKNLRIRAEAETKAWLGGKPVRSVSELKLFGD